MSTANLSDLVSSPNLLNLVSTTYLGTQLASTVVGLSNVAVTRVQSGFGIGIFPAAGTGIVTINNTGVTNIVAGTNISLNPPGGTGSVTINAASGITTDNLTSTVIGLATVGYVSSISGLVSTQNLEGLVSTQNLVNLVSTANLSGLVSTQNLVNLVSTANLAGLVSTQNLVDLVSTTFFDSKLTSTVVGLSNVAVTKIIPGAAISVSPGGGVGDVTVTNEGVTSITAGTNITITSGTGAVTINAAAGPSPSTWSQYPATQEVTLANGKATIINPNEESILTLQTQFAGIFNSNEFPASLGLGSLTFLISSLTEAYTLENSRLYTGSISSFALARTDDRGTTTGSLYLSSIYFGSTGGTHTGYLTPSPVTANHLFYNGSQLAYVSSLTSSLVGLSNIAVTKIVAGTNVTISPTNGLGSVTINASGGGGGSSTVPPYISSFGVSTGTLFAGHLSSITLSTINVYAATLNMSVVFI